MSGNRTKDLEIKLVVDFLIDSLSLNEYKKYRKPFSNKNNTKKGDFNEIVLHNMRTDILEHLHLKLKEKNKSDELSEILEKYRNISIPDRLTDSDEYIYINEKKICFNVFNFKTHDPKGELKKKMDNNNKVLDVFITIRTLKDRIIEAEKQLTKTTKNSREIEKIKTKIKNLLNNNIFDIRTYTTQHNSIDVIKKTSTPMTMYTIVLILTDFQVHLSTLIAQLITEYFSVHFHHIIASHDNIIINCSNEADFYKILGIISSKDYGELNENNNLTSTFKHSKDNQAQN